MVYRGGKEIDYLPRGSLTYYVYREQAKEPNAMLQNWEQFRISVHDVKDQLRDYVYGQSLKAFAKGDAARDAVTNTEQLEARRQTMRERLLAEIGGLPPRDTPLHPVTTGIVKRDGYRIENIIFQSMPSVYVTSHLYIPDGRSSPGGAVLFVCGHGPEGKLYPSYQHVCQCLVRAGLVVLAIDPMGQGERLGYRDRESDKPFARRVAEHEHVGVQCWPLGDGLARYFIHDIVRAVDYLSSRPEVDPAKIGMTGSSGGGTQTALAMICEPRIAAAAPGTFIMNRESYLFAGQAQDAEQIWPNMSALGFDHEDILLGMVPRPVLVLAVTGDIFPIEGTRRTVQRCRRFWDMYGCGGGLQLAEDESHHMYTL
ncbi:MAG TPA: prolyl oligopeptidase family serine peptidase, partial [Rariglobus sp.]